MTIAGGSKGGREGQKPNPPAPFPLREGGDQLPAASGIANGRSPPPRFEEGPGEGLSAYGWSIMKKSRGLRANGWFGNASVPPAAAGIASGPFGGPYLSQRPWNHSPILCPGLWVSRPVYFFPTGGHDFLMPKSRLNTGW